MASWDLATDAEAKRLGLHCLACDRPLDESLALVGSLRCLDCRESNAPLRHDVQAQASKRSEVRKLFRRLSRS
jgi:hypothetical protein